MSDLNCKEGVGETDSCSLCCLWCKTGKGAKRDVILDAGCGVDYGVVIHIRRASKTVSLTK